MFRSKLFKLPQHRQFTYQPRHYNAEAEELQERIRRVELRKAGKTDEDINAMKRRISLNFREGGSGSVYKPAINYTRRAKYRSNVILLCTLVGLVFLAYYLFTIFLPKIDHWLS